MRNGLLWQHTERGMFVDIPKQKLRISPKAESIVHHISHPQGERVFLSKSIVKGYRGTSLTDAYQISTYSIPVVHKECYGMYEYTEMKKLKVYQNRGVVIFDVEG